MRELWSMRLATTTAAAVAGAAIICLVFRRRGAESKTKISTQGSSKDDLLPKILEKSAPVAAAEELASSSASTCERRLNGQQLIITADADVANYVFNNESSKGNYVRRPAANEGLQELGMLTNGLIWNNDLPIWRRIRGCFQKALGEAALQRAVSIASQECKALLQQQRHEQGCDLLELTRQVTFRTTLEVFFGLRSCDFLSRNIDEGAFIAAIVSYFKAWEFFLFRPRSAWDHESAATDGHRASIADLRGHVRTLLAATPSQSINGSTTTRPKKLKSPLFIDHLRQVCADDKPLLEQSSLEMLLAGTDTSSVTAYYALLGLAGNPQLQQELRNGANSSSLLGSVINETLRFKPVGPIVLRQAVAADSNFPGGIRIQAGAAVLVHLAAMNLREELWDDPHTFRPQRFLNRNGPKQDRKTFFPFGEGPKGCIGMHLGRREVTAILKTVLQHYELSIPGMDTLSSLETHWDIANQPDTPALIALRQIASGKQVNE